MSESEDDLFDSKSLLEDQRHNEIGRNSFGKIIISNHSDIYNHFLVSFMHYFRIAGNQLVIISEYNFGFKNEAQNVIYWYWQNDPLFNISDYKKPLFIKTILTTKR